jgi:outer membrane immunogenic protein
MKSLAITAAAIGVLAIAAPALAQPWDSVSAYGNLGIDDFNANNANIGGVTGRLGARFGRYFGVEGELSGGFDSAPVNIGGTKTSVTLRDQYAAYGVGYLPVLPNADLFARLGYGASDLHFSQPGNAFNNYAASWNIGGGGQYFLDPKDGVRADYTRENFDHADLNANVWSLAYVRKF